MNTKGKKIMITAAVIFAAGIVFTIIGIMLGGWPGLKVSRSGVSSAYKVEKPYELTKTKLDKFTKINIALNYADVEILISDDNQYYVEYFLDGNSGEPLCNVNDNTLTFQQKVHSESILFFGGFLASPTDDEGFAREPYLRLYIPKDTKLSSLGLSSESGTFELNNIKAESAKIDSEYGTCHINDSVFDELSFSVESADLKMNNSTAKSFSFTGDYGEIVLKNFSSDAVQMELESYDVRIEAAKLGDLDYNNQYGELELALPDEMDTYSFNISVEYGDITLPNSAAPGYYANGDEDTKIYRTEGSSDKKINITCESGDVEIH